MCSKTNTNKYLVLSHQPVQCSADNTSLVCNKKKEENPTLLYYICWQWEEEKHSYSMTSCFQRYKPKDALIFLSLSLSKYYCIYSLKLIVGLFASQRPHECNERKKLICLKTLFFKSKIPSTQIWSIMQGFSLSPINNSNGNAYHQTWSST